MNPSNINDTILRENKLFLDVNRNVNANIGFEPIVLCFLRMTSVALGFWSDVLHVLERNKHIF